MLSVMLLGALLAILFFASFSLKTLSQLSQFTYRTDTWIKIRAYITQAAISLGAILIIIGLTILGVSVYIVKVYLG